METLRKYDEKGQYDNIMNRLDPVFRKNVITCALFGGFEEDEGWRRECMDELSHLYSLDYADRYREDLVILNPYILKQDILSRDEISGENKLSVYDSIKWDYKAMIKSNIVSFYISEKCTNAMSLFELGNVLGSLDMDNDSRFRVVVSISSDYPNREALYTYLEEIIMNKDVLSSVVNCHATPKSHALAIYNSYKYFVTRG